MVADPHLFDAVLLIRIRMFLGHLDPDLLVRGPDPVPVPDPLSSSKN
jgi:hypothetical protein